MNLKTTFTLVILAAAGAGFWFVLHQQQPKARASETLEVLRTRIIPDKVNRIEVVRGDGSLVLERTPGGTWSLPGAWPTRRHEVEELISLITSGLQTRFAPVPLTDDPPDLKPYGLDPSQKPITVLVRSGEQDYRLTFGEKPGADNRFSGPTMLRLNENKEVLTLAPNLVALLNRPVDYYQQRRLFNVETVKDSDGSERRDQLAAQSLQVKGKAGTYTVRPAAAPAGADAAPTQTGTDWDLVEPVRDHADPDKLKAVLTAVPDIWADQFIHKPAKDLAEYGLSNPEQTITVTGKQGDKVVLLIGKESPHKGKRTVTRPAPAAFPGQPPGQPTQETVPVVFRYAKLQNNDQIFEIQVDKLKDIFVAPDTLRDAQLARFRTDEARRLEIHYAGQDIVAVKEKNKWKLQKPLEGEAESAKITELLSKLSGLQARDKDVLDKADLKSLELSPAAGTVKVVAEETHGEGDHKTTKEKSFTFLLGKNDVEKSKLAVQVDGWPRVNLVDNTVVALLKRPALAYRNRRILDFTPADLARAEIQRGGEKYVLEQDKSNWRLTSPVKAEAEATKAERLAEDLGRLEAVEYVANAPKDDELEKLYGLGKPALSATLTFTKKDKPARTLLIGKQRGDKQEYFAKLASDPGIFVVRKDARDALDQGSLAYRRLHPWQLNAADVAEIRHRKGDQEYQLKREGLSWKIVKPFQATAVAKAVDPLVNELANPAVERYETHEAKDLASFGLDKPALRLTVIPAEKKPSAFSDQPSANKTQEKEKTNEKDARKSEAAKPRVLLIGKPTAEGAKSRFAKVEDDPAVFVVGDKLLASVDRSALDLLDRKLLALDTGAITQVKSSGPKETATLKRDKGAWQVESPAAKFTADGEVMGIFLGTWFNVEAEKFAAYGPKVDWAAYGLDQPTRTVTVTLTPAKAGADSKPVKPEEHTIILGKEVPGEAGARYGRVDHGPGVVVFAPVVAEEFGRTALDFADRTMLKLDAAKVTAVTRKGGGREFALAKEKDAWQITKPQKWAADGPTLDNLVQDLAELRARRVAAYAPKDLKPFGLDQPEAVVELRGGDQTVLGELRIGKTVGATGGDRFVQAAGAKTVGVLSAALVDRLLAAPLQFRDRNLARLTDVDRVMMERGARRVVFSREGLTWKMTSPVAVEAEQADLEAFLKSLEHLRADQLVADKPTDLKAFGLDKPAVRWHLLAGGKEVLSLLVGAHEKVDGAGKEKQGPRLYAKLATGDLVFLLDPKLSQQALGEYRSRSVWGPLDAVQVDTVRYGYAKNPFTLEKKGDIWQVAGKPDVKIIGETVSETLDALARLKPERYVADKDPDLKLYGLEPPELVLEIQTPAGKRALYVGRTEGGSKRYYAKAWEGNYNAVFVLSEADSALIVRDVNAFTKPPIKKPEPAGRRPGAPRRPPGVPPVPPR